MPAFLRNLTYEGVPVWKHAHIVQWTLQIVSGVAVVALVVWFIANIGVAIDSRNIPFGFGFLDIEYQTPIGEHFIPYDPSNTYLYALVVAAVNTLVVAVLGVIIATILGIIIGVSRLSSNWLVSKLALVYVEFFRNVPLLVQLLFWFFIVLTLPQVREGFVFFDALYVNNSGISIPGPSGIGGIAIFLIWVGFVILAIAAGVFVNRRLAERELALGGVAHPVLAGWVVALAVIIGSWFILSLVTGTSPIEWSMPAPEGRFGRIAGGFTIQAGLLVLLLGLVIYTAAVHCGDSQSGDPVRWEGASGGGAGDGPDAHGIPSIRDISPGPPGNHSAADQPVPEPDQEQQLGRRHRVPGVGRRGDYDDAERAGNIHIHSYYVSVLSNEFDVVSDWESVQSPYQL